MYKAMKLFFVLAFCLFTSLPLWAQTPITIIPNQNLYDSVSMFSDTQALVLEKRLDRFYDSTKIRVYIITSANQSLSLDSATQIIPNWREDSLFKTAILIYIKVKPRENKSQVIIFASEELKTTLPRALSQRIIHRIVKPYFSEKDYPLAINKALDKIFPILKGEYNDKKHRSLLASLAIPFICVFCLVWFLILYYGRKKDGDHFDNSGNTKSGNFTSSILLGRIFGNQKPKHEFWDKFKQKTGAGGYGCDF